MENTNHSQIMEQKQEKKVGTSIIDHMDYTLDFKAKLKA